MVSEDRATVLERQIATLKDMPGMESKVKELEVELDTLRATAPTPAPSTGKGRPKAATEAPPEGMLWTEASEKEYQEASSMFPIAGKWPVEFGIPSLYETGRSLMWPFTVLSPAPFAGRDDFIWSDREAKGIFKVKEILEAIGVRHEVNPETGKVGFNPAEVVGKRAKVVYVVEGTYIDADGVEKISTIAKAKNVISMDAETGSLGI